MIRCAYCDSVTLALDLNGVDAHVCPLCGAVFARRYGNMNRRIPPSSLTCRTLCRSSWTRRASR